MAAVLAAKPVGPPQAHSPGSASVEPMQLKASAADQRKPAGGSGGTLQAKATNPSSSAPAKALPHKLAAPPPNAAGKAPATGPSTPSSILKVPDLSGPSSSSSERDVTPPMASPKRTASFIPVGALSSMLPLTPPRPAAGALQQPMTPNAHAAAAGGTSGNLPHVGASSSVTAPTARRSLAGPVDAAAAAPPTPSAGAPAPPGGVSPLRSGPRQGSLIATPAPQPLPGLLSEYLPTLDSRPLESNFMLRSQARGRRSTFSGGVACDGPDDPAAAALAAAAACLRASSKSPMSVRTAPVSRGSAPNLVLPAVPGARTLLAAPGAAAAAAASAAAAGSVPTPLAPSGRSMTSLTSLMQRPLPPTHTLFVDPEELDGLRQRRHHHLDPDAQTQALRSWQSYSQADMRAGVPAGALGQGGPASPTAAASPMSLPQLVSPFTNGHPAQQEPGGSTAADAAGQPQQNNKSLAVRIANAASASFASLATRSVGNANTGCSVPLPPSVSNVRRTASEASIMALLQTPRSPTHTVTTATAGSPTLPPQQPVPSQPFSPMTHALSAPVGGLPPAAALLVTPSALSAPGAEALFAGEASYDALVSPRGTNSGAVRKLPQGAAAAAQPVPVPPSVQRSGKPGRFSHPGEATKMLLGTLQEENEVEEEDLLVAQKAAKLAMAKATAAMAAAAAVRGGGAASIGSAGSVGGFAVPGSSPSFSGGAAAAAAAAKHGKAVATAVARANGPPSPRRAVIGAPPATAAAAAAATANAQQSNMPRIFQRRFASGVAGKLAS